MKTTSKIWGAFLIGLAIWGLIAFVVIITTTKNKSYMPYSTVDSIRNAEIEKVKADYLIKLDSIKAKIDTLKPKIKWLRAKADIIYVGNDTSCIQTINRKNNLISGLDSLNFELDKEAQIYSAMLDSTEIQLGIEIRRNYTLSDSICKIKLFYDDSLLNINKRLYNGFIDRQFKLISNKYRESVMKKATRK